MSVNINILKNAQSLDVSEIQSGYSKVVITVGTDSEGNEIVYTSGDDTGSVLYVNNPFGTQAMADSILNQVRGYQYQPYTASGALLDPSAELGDGITINNVYSGIYQRNTTFGQLMSQELSAPSSDEVEHEYDTTDEIQERRFNTFIASTKATLSVLGNEISAEVQQRTTADETLTGLISATATQVSAKVSKTGGNSSSFGWVLNDNSWVLNSNNRQVFKADSNGVQIEGTISATSGGIAGFNINSRAIWNGISEFGGSQTYGVYIGNDGIQLGQNFKVNSGGYVEASGGTFSGTIDCRSLIVDGESVSPSLLRRAISGGSGYSSSGFSGSGQSLSTNYLRVTYLGASNVSCTGGVYTQGGITCQGGMTVGGDFLIKGNSVTKKSKTVADYISIPSDAYVTVTTTSKSSAKVITKTGLLKSIHFTTLNYWG